MKCNIFFTPVNNLKIYDKMVLYWQIIEWIFKQLQSHFGPIVFFRCGASANSAKLQGHLLFYYSYNRGKSVAIKMSGKPEMSDKNQNLVKTFSGSHNKFTKKK